MYHDLLQILLSFKCDINKRRRKLSTLIKKKIGLKSDRIDRGMHPIGQTCRQTVAPICVNHFSMQTLIGQFEDVSNLVSCQKVSWICVNCGPFAISNENILIDQSVKRLLPRRFNFYCLLWKLLEAEVNRIFQIKIMIVLLYIFWSFEQENNHIS